MSSTLGSGSGALDKINSELQKQGLEKSTGLDVVAANKSDNTGLIVGTKIISRSSNSRSTLFLFQVNLVLDSSQSVTRVISWCVAGLVVGLGGGAILIVAIAAYYLYVVKPAAQLPPKTRDLETAPVVAPSAPIVAPAASLG